jgi:hypothetical protein
LAFEQHLDLERVNFGRGEPAERIRFYFAGAISLAAGDPEHGRIKVVITGSAADASASSIAASAGIWKILAD